MGSFSTILIIVLVLVACVVAITVIQKREQIKAELRQKVSQHKYRANQAASILANFSQQPIGTEARLILLHYSLANLKAIKRLSPNELNINESIATIENSIQNPLNPADKQRLTIPNDLVLLTKQVNQLSALAKFILKLSKTTASQPQLASVAVKQIMGLISESKICAYIQQGKESLSKHDYVPAQRSFIMAQQMLLKVSEKNERLQTLEQELKELITSTPAQAMNAHLSFDHPQPNGDPTGKEGHDHLFGPRKKW